MFKKFMFLCVCLLAGAGVVSAARAQTIDEIIKRGELAVAIDLTNPPWGFLDAKQEPSGFDPDLAKLIADRMGVKLRIERVTSQSRIPYLQSGRADMILATLSVTPERSRQVWFTIPYAPNPQILIAPKNKTYRSYADLKGARVAVPRGSPQDLLVTKMAPDAIMTRFDDDASALQALITGQADLLGGGMPIPAVLNKMDPGKNYEAKIVLSSLFMSMAVRKGDSDLLQFLNTQIFLLKQSGELDQISRKYFDVPIGDLPVF
jgi:polar amino acid transport system substrate-binding protein